MWKAFPCHVIMRNQRIKAVVEYNYFDGAKLRWNNRTFQCHNDIFVMMRNVTSTVYPKKYAHGFVVLCFVVVMQSFIMNSHEVFIHIHQGCFAGTGAIVRLPQCQWSKPDRYGKISQCITTTKHSKAKTVCIFLRIYCNKQWFPIVKAMLLYPCVFLVKTGIGCELYKFSGLLHI